MSAHPLTGLHGSSILRLKDCSSIGGIAHRGDDRMERAAWLELS